MDNPNQCYTPKQVASVLMLSRSKTYELIASGEIPSIKIGWSRRVPAAFLDTYVKRLCELADSL
jgi:excisionase family DNA binding protein